MTDVAARIRQHWGLFEQHEQHPYKEPSQMSHEELRAEHAWLSSWESTARLLQAELAVEEAAGNIRIVYDR